MKNLSTFLLQIICSVCFLTQWTLAQQNVSNEICASKARCNECIQIYGCGWCSDPNFKDKRCSKSGESSKCSDNYFINPKIETTGNESDALTEVIKRDDSVSDSSSQKKIVQVMPQILKVNLRPNEGNPYKFKIWYKRVKDYPIDLYYLMDLSQSMKVQRDKLSALGEELASTMKKISSNFSLGFGSFVDKVEMPYVNILPEKLKTPCEDCTAPFGFQHVMSLNQNTSQFSDKVKSANLSGNLDGPEGGFDAIMQAIVCHKQIGWRDHARKLLVFSTDDSFHYAGDGKLGGVTKPNDGCCHLNENGQYTHSSILDYPSVSHINSKLKENSINLIFAVTQKQIELYKELTNFIEGSSAGELSSDSSNVVELVKNEYDKITSKVELQAEGLGSDFRIRYFTKCKNYPDLIETNKCEGFKVDDTIEFDVELELLRCPYNLNTNENVHKFDIRLEVDKLTVEVQLMCDCNNCSNPGHPSYKENSPKCSGKGTLKCGVCECYPGFSGENCGCGDSDVDKIDKCSPKNSTRICSDRGSCKCNKCECRSDKEDEPIFGEFCQCSNFNCPRYGGKLCSGFGQCNCGSCKCNTGWIKDDCSCHNSTSNCIPQNGNEADSCSGHGKCVCNKCECEQAGGYWGAYCQKCPTCNNRCNDLKSCVQCRVHQSGSLTKEQCDSKCSYNITIIEGLSVDHNVDYVCSFDDDQGCTFSFIYEAIGSRVNIIAEKNKKCPPEAHMPVVFFSLILGIVLFGLALLLLWKFVTVIQDRREFAKFEKEKEKAKWDAGHNPIYKQPTSTFKNPTYCGSSKLD
ncbi:integrin beta-PS-like [Planococcus citri]|uniref:integrin beta-PS-like n=1 Tax=Planococcus citri TaxID=170843 RepID=UPI0031F9E26F